LFKENAGQPDTRPTQSGERVSQGLIGARESSTANKEMKFTALLHHLTVDLLWEGYPFNSNVVPFLFASSELETVLHQLRV